MSHTMRFIKKPGDLAIQSAPDEEPAVLYGDTTPDDVRLPDELGGGVVRVTGAHVAPCPKCGANARHYTLVGDLGVAECVVCREFVWYRRRAAGDGEDNAG